MRRRRRFDTFSLSFLDIMSCGFGAVVLFYMIISATMAIRSDELNKNLSERADKLRVEASEGEDNLVELRNTLEETEKKIVEARGLSRRIIELIEDNDLDGLRSITDVDGVAVDMGAILDATGSDLDRRLDTLADLLARAGTPNPGAVEATETARRVLEQSKFEIGGEGFLDRLGALILAWLDRFLAWLSSALGGPTNTALVVIGVVVLAGLAAFTFLYLRRGLRLEATAAAFGALAMAFCSWSVPPTIEYGYGDFTVGLFEKETGVKVPASDGPQRFNERESARGILQLHRTAQ